MAYVTWKAESPYYSVPYGTDTFFIKDGKIVEQGKHTELLAQKGYYHTLYTRQYEDEATARILA